LADWGNERRFVDTSGDYLFSGSSSNGEFNTTYFSPGTQFAYHASISGYEDVFGEYTVPTCGSMTPGDAQSTGFYTQLTIGQYDSGPIYSSNLSMGYTPANDTNVKAVKDVSYTVATNKKIKLSQITFNEMKKFSGGGVGDGVRSISLKITSGTSGSGSADLRFYDYAAGIDKTKYLSSSSPQYYDSNDYAEDKNALANVFASQGDTITFRWTVYADIVNADQAGSGATNDGKISVGSSVKEEILGGGIGVYDAEGTDLWTGAAVTG